MIKKRIIGLFLIFLILMGSGYLFFRRVPPAKVLCLAVGHDWVWTADTDWRLVYSPKGGNYPLGYKYHFKKNKIFCIKCASVLIDRSIVDDNIYPIQSGETILREPETVFRPRAYPEAAREGIVTAYYDGGAVRSRWSWRRGRLNGLSRDFYPDGKIWNEWSCINDRLEGVVRSYHPNGKLQSWEFYKHHRRDGPSREFFSGGSLKHEYFYENGTLEGPAKILYPDGTPRRSEVYRKGLIQGLRKDFYPSGNIQKERLFKNSKLHGTAKEYEETGHLLYERHFVKGREVQRVKYSRDGHRESVTYPNIDKYEEVLPDTIFSPSGR